MKAFHNDDSIKEKYLQRVVDVASSYAAYVKQSEELLKLLEYAGLPQDRGNG